MSFSAKSTRRRRHLLVCGGIALALLGCRDELAAPADCPALCPGGQPPVLDTVLVATQNGDQSFLGYVVNGLGPSLRISNGLPASEDRAIVTFLPRPDSLTVRDSLRKITSLDSAVISLTLQARDTLVTGLKIFIYRLSPAPDTTTTFADVEPQLAPAALIDSIIVPDSVKTGVLRTVISGADTTRLQRDSLGRLSVGFKITANAPTGIRIASIAATGSPSFTSYVRVEIDDSALVKQTITRFPQFNAFVSQNPPAADSLLLPVGGAPSARALLRFGLPLGIRDSVTILRATLELAADSPILGLPNDDAFLQAFGVLGDLGAKSPIISSGSTIGVTQILSGTTGAVTVDVTRLVRLWQGTSGLPPIIFLALSPEAASFTRPVFRSTRSASGAPQIRITYFQRFPFERP